MTLVAFVRDPAIFGDFWRLHRQTDVLESLDDLEMDVDMDGNTAYALMHELQGEICHSFHELIRVYDDLQDANDAARKFLEEEYGPEVDARGNENWETRPVVTIRSDGTIYVEAVGLEGEVLTVWVQTVSRRRRRQP